MTMFRVLYEVSSFKFAFNELLELDEGSRAQIVSVVRSAPGQEPDVPDELSPAVAALRSLREIVSDESLDSVLKDIEQVGPPDAIAKLGDLTNHFSRTSDEEELTFLRNVERSALPILNKARFYVDLRTTELPDTQELRLVPVVVARFEFDEAISGNDSVTFQLTASSIKKFKSDLEDALATLRRSVELVGYDLVPEYFQAVVSDTDDDAAGKA